MPAHAQGATFTVTSTADGGPGSLRAALASAANGDTINAAGVSGTILLTSGELVVARNVTILGPGPGSLAVDGNAASRVFHIGSNTVVSISGLTITNGYTIGITLAESGGGIFNDHATLTVSNVTVAGNSATDFGGRDLGGFGGGIGNAGKLTVANSTLSGNYALTSGGGIYNYSGTAEIINSTLSGNGATFGGGIESYGMLTVSGSTLSGNGANRGGGIRNFSAALTVAHCNVNSNLAVYGSGICNDEGTLIVSNCTVSGNLDINGGGDFNYGGGIYNEVGIVEVINTTLAGNLAAEGGGIYNAAGLLTLVHTTLSGNRAEIGGGVENLNGILTVTNCLVALNTATTGPDLSGSFTGGFNFIGGDPLLGPLQDNGGPTMTMALLPGSPCRNAGDPGFSGPPDWDQRGPGFPRVTGGRVDIGAFEAPGSAPGAPLLSITLTTTNTALVSWPFPSAGFSLQQNTDLGTTNWIAPSQTVTNNGAVHFIIIHPPAGNRFYRLFKP